MIAASDRHVSRTHGNACCVCTSIRLAKSCRPHGRQAFEKETRYARQGANDPRNPGACVHNPDQERVVTMPEMKFGTPIRLRRITRPNHITESIEETEARIREGRRTDARRMRSSIGAARWSAQACTGRERNRYMTSDTTSGDGT